MSLHSFVHCHICPLKDLCGFAEPENSYKATRNPEAGSDEMGYDIGLLFKTKANCPLLRKILVGEERT